MYDAIVIGTGGVGSGAFHHLARRGARVLAIDRFGIAHDRGSSHGRTRIIRKAYFEHPDYVPLCERAYESWAAIESETGRTLYHETGLMLAGPADGEVVAGARLSSRRYGVPIENLSVGDARERFAQFRFPDDVEVVLEPAAGFLDVEACVRSHVEQAIAAGGTFVTDRVREWNADESGITVRTGSATHRAARVIVSLGSYHVLPPGFGILRKVQLWFPMPHDALDRDRGTPAFLFDLPGGAFYGFPRIDGRTVKVAEHSGGEPVADVEQLDRGLHERDVAGVARFVGAHLPGVASKPCEHSVCTYTMSPNGHFVVGPSPASDRVLIAMGLSGHGFKFTGVLGEALADLATIGATEIPIGFLAP